MLRWKLLRARLLHKNYTCNLHDFYTTLCRISRRKNMYVYICCALPSTFARSTEVHSPKITSPWHVQCMHVFAAVAASVCSDSCSYIAAKSRKPSILRCCVQSDCADYLTDFTQTIVTWLEDVFIVDAFFRLGYIWLDIDVKWKLDFVTQICGPIQLLYNMLPTKLVGGVASYELVQQSSLLVFRSRICCTTTLPASHVGQHVCAVKYGYNHDA